MFCVESWWGNKWGQWEGQYNEELKKQCLCNRLLSRWMSACRETPFKCRNDCSVLPGCDTALLSNRISTFRSSVNPHTKGSNAHEDPWKVTVRYVETSGSDYILTQRHIPEEWNCQLHSCVNLKTLKFKDVFIRHRVQPVGWSPDPQMYLLTERETDRSSSCCDWWGMYGPTGYPVLHTSLWRCG